MPARVRAYGGSRLYIWLLVSGHMDAYTYYI